MARKWHLFCGRSCNKPLEKYITFHVASPFIDARETTLLCFKRLTIFFTSVFTSRLTLNAVSLPGRKSSSSSGWITDYSLRALTALIRTCLIRTSGRFLFLLLPFMIRNVIVKRWGVKRPAAFEWGAVLLPHKRKTNRRFLELTVGF